MKKKLLILALSEKILKFCREGIIGKFLFEI